MTTMMTLVNRTDRGTGKLIRRGILLSKYQYEALLNEEYLSYQWWIHGFPEEVSTPEAASQSVIRQNVCQKLHENKTN